LTWRQPGRRGAKKIRSPIIICGTRRKSKRGGNAGVTRRVVPREAPNQVPEAKRCYEKKESRLGRAQKCLTLLLVGRRGVNWSISQKREGGKKKRADPLIKKTWKPDYDCPPTPNERDCFGKGECRSQIVRKGKWLGPKKAAHRKRHGTGGHG